MPAKSPEITEILKENLRALGQQLRDRREQLGISATITAEAAGMSRVTLHRIERGEASVAMGAYLSVAFSLGLNLEFKDKKSKKYKADFDDQDLPQKILIADYKQLKKLAWQLSGVHEMSHEEALNIYERNWRHVDVNSMEPQEQKLLKALLKKFGREKLLV